MPNFSSVLKAEITRLARRETKIAVEPLRKSNASLRREMAELKRQFASTRRELKASTKPVRKVSGDSNQETTRRFSAGGLKSLRMRLGLSAADMGQLIGASGQSVYNWEAGKAVPRATHRMALASLRGIGKRDAMKRLEAKD